TSCCRGDDLPCTPSGVLRARSLRELGASRRSRGRTSCCRGDDLPCTPSGVLGLARFASWALRAGAEAGRPLAGGPISSAPLLENESRSRNRRSAPGRPRTTSPFFLGGQADPPTIRPCLNEGEGRPSPGSCSGSRYRPSFSRLSFSPRSFPPASTWPI